MATIANPRLIDVFGIDLKQEDVDFAIPRLHQDIPLYIDPFLLWVSDRTDFRDLHERIVQFLRLVSQRLRAGDTSAAAELLAGCEEPQAMGLGYAASNRAGSNIGPKLIGRILTVMRDVPQLLEGKARHLEELQLVVPGIAEDRISDTASAIVKDFFIRYTAEQSAQLGIPTRPARLGSVFDPVRELLVPANEAQLPYNPVDDTPVLFAPLSLLRHLPWINYEDYYRSSFSTRVLEADRARKKVAKEAVLEFNARNYRRN